MINVENDNEPIIYEQPIYSHIYQNHDHFLLIYYTRPISNNTTKEKIGEKVEEKTEEKSTERSSTNNIYQNIPKEPQLQKQKIWTIPFLLEKPKSKQFQTPDFRFSSRFRSRIKCHQHSHLRRNKNSTPKINTLQNNKQTSNRTRINLNKLRKTQLFLVPTRTMEQNKLMSKPFKQTFHISDIKNNIIGLPFITQYIPTIKILNSRIHIKDKYTRMKNTAFTLFQRINKQPPFFSKFYPIYNQERKYLKPLSGNVYNFSIKQLHHYDEEHKNNISLCLTLNSDQFTNFSE